MREATTILLTLLCSILSAQMYDAQWVIGPNTSVVDFWSPDSIRTYAINSGMNTYLANACISDENGNLLYYTNGIYVAGSNGDSLLNGNNLSPCAFTTEYEAQGNPIQQSVMFLPMPGSSRYYYLFHFSGDSTGGHPGTMYYSLIDKQGNSDSGEVVHKNIIYYKSVFRGGGMTACKHANGRDWWIVIGKFDSNGFYKFLLTPQGISHTMLQNIGPIYNGPLDDTYSCFSTDGSKYVTGTYGGLITVLDFDRCTGEFSNPVTISNIPAGYTESGSGGVAFSPNGRFIYATDRINLTQYDLWANNIQDSVEVYLANDSDYAQISMIALAPNGKLYGSTWNGGFYFLHVVNNPDLKGDSCGFVWGGQPTLSDNSFNLPNMPNYNLGTLVGSGCDTITSNKSVTINSFLRVMPNPADKYVYVEMGMQGNYEFDLLNAMGQVIDKKETRQVDIFDTEKLSTGIYIIRVIDKTTNTEITTKKLVIAH